MGPFDYTFQQPTDPFGSAVKGFEYGTLLNESDRQRAAEEAQAQAAQQRQAQISEIQNRYYSTKQPTAQDFMQYASTLDSKMIEPMLKAFQESGAEGQRQTLQQLSQIGSSLKAGDGKSAAALIRQRGEAFRNAGNDAYADAAEVQAQVAEKNPSIAMKSIVPLMVALPGGPEAVQAIFGSDKTEAETTKIGMETQELTSKASLAATAAKFAESKAVLDLKMGEAQIKKMAADTEIARMNVQIAAMNAATSREGNSIKRRENELKLREMEQKRDDTLREKVGKVESARSAIDNTLNTIDKLFKNPAWKDVVGSLEGRMPEAASMLDDQESNAIALINTIGSQVFLSAVKEAGSMTGLTEKEGEKLQSSLASLGRAQGEDAFQENAREAQRLLIKGRKGLVSRYGLPDTIPDTPAVRPSGGEVDSILKKLGVK